MAELGVGYLSIIPEMGKVKPEVAKAFGGLDSVAAKSGTSMGGKLAGAMGKTLKAGALGAGVAAGGVLATALTKGMGRLNALDQAQAKMRGLGYSADEVSSLMDSVNTSVKGTSFGLDEAAGSAAKLGAVGVKTGQDMDRAMTLTADIAAQAGTSMDDISSIMAKIEGSGKVTGETLAQLDDRATGAGAAIAEHFNVSIEEMREMVSRGEISAEDFADAMEKHLGGAAQKTGETVQGAFANMGSALGRLGAKIAGPLFSAAPAIFGSIGDTFDRLGESLEPVIEQVSNWLAPKLEHFASSTVPMLGDALIGAVEGMVQFGTWVSNNASWIGPLVVAIGTLVAGYQLLAFHQTIMVAGGFLKWLQTLTVITRIQTAAQAAFNVVMAANPIALVVIAIAALVAGLVYFFTQTELGRQVWANFTSFLSSAWTAVSAALVAGWSWIKTAVFDAFSAASQWLSGVWSAVTNALSAAWSAVQAVFSAVWAAIKTAVFDAFVAYVSRVQSNWQSATSAMSGAFNAFKTSVANAVANVKTHISNMVTSIGQIPGKIKGFFSNAGSWLVNAGKNIINGLVNGIKSMVGAVGNAIGSILPEKVRGFVGLASGGMMLADGAVHGRRFAAGGKERHEAQIARAGEWRVWAEPETGGEAYIPLAKSKRGRSTKILSAVAGHFGMSLMDKDGQWVDPARASDVAPKSSAYFADGGVTKQQLLDFAWGRPSRGHTAKRPLEGAPYVWGGTNWGDCSGAMSALARFVAGVDPFGGRFATGNQREALAALGAKPGRGGANDFTIGWFNGGPYGGHTSGTIGGTNVEMGGGRGNGQIGGRAAPATHPQYTDHAHFSLLSKPPTPPKMNEILPQDEIGQIDASLQDTGQATSTTVNLTPEEAAKATAAKALGDQTLLEWGANGVFDLLGLGNSSIKKILTTKGSDLLGSDDIVTTKTVSGTAKEQPTVPVSTAKAPPVVPPEGADAEVEAPKPQGPSWGPQFFAHEIARKAKDMGLDRLAAKIGLATALVESGDPLKMWANRAVPESLSFRHDAIGSDHDSVGLFQQRNNGAWGTVKQRMTPYDSAGLFFNVLKGFDYKSMDPGAAAQKVQVSAFPDRYGQKMGAADALLKRTGVFDRGGYARGTGFMKKDIIEPERVLSAQQTRSFDKLVYEELPKQREGGGGMTLVINMDNEELMRRRIDTVNGRVEVNTKEIKRLVDAKRPLASARTRGGAM